jgi:hypothetical protein
MDEVCILAVDMEDVLQHTENKPRDGKNFRE